VLAYTVSLLTAVVIALSAIIGVIFKVMYLVFDYRLGFTIKKHGIKEVSSYFLIQAQKGSVAPICGDTAKSWVQGMWCV